MKLTVHKAINKAFINWGCRVNDDKIPILYVKKLLNKKQVDKNPPFIIVDFNKKKREWYINYIPDFIRLYTATIDDLTGATSINIIN